MVRWRQIWGFLLLCSAHSFAQTRHYSFDCVQVGNLVQCESYETVDTRGLAHLRHGPHTIFIQFHPLPVEGGTSFQFVYTGGRLGNGAVALQGNMVLHLYFD